jgi:hypothetical protein
MYPGEDAIMSNIAHIYEIQINSKAMGIIWE